MRIRYVSVLTGLDMLAVKADAASLGLLDTGSALLIVALRHFQRIAHPMLDLSPIHIPTFRASLLGGSISRIAIGSLPFLLPLMFQLGFGLDALHASSLLLIVFAGNISMKLVTPTILRRFGYRKVMLTNRVLAEESLASYALIGPDTRFALIIPILLVNCMTRCMQFTSLGTLAFSDAPARQMAHANSLFNVVSQVRMAAGITLGAISVQLGKVLAQHLLFNSPAVEYEVALVLVAVVAFFGLVDTMDPPKGAGDHFVGRS